MPPLAAIEMGERLQEGYDVESQVVQVNNATGKSQNVPTFVLTAARENRVPAKKEPCNFLPLPSSQYRYTKWHDIQCMEVKGSMLRSPRIRRAPKGYSVTTIHAMEEQDEPKHKSARERWKERKRLHYQSKLEAWGTCEAVNLSYQELGDPYQVKQFLAVLQKLIRCESLQLIENRLEDLSTVFLPRCEHLNLQRNFLSSLKKLPKSPQLTHLSLQQNNIKSLDGLGRLRKTNIISLTLRDNPVELDPQYRQKVFKLLPNLQILDDIPRLKNDTVESVSSTCVIS